MKRIIPLFLILTAFAYSSEKTMLLIPDENQPFFLNSPAGQLSVEKKEGSEQATLRILTEGDGRAVQATAHDLPPYSLEGRHLIVWVKFRNVESLKDFWIYTATGNDFADRIVYMPSDDRTQFTENEWTCLRLSPAAGKTWGEPDRTGMTAFQFWLSDNGTAPVSVDIGPVYMEEAAEESVLIMTFDDGWKSQIDRAAPIMADKGLKGTAYIIPELVGTEGYMSEEDLTRLTGEFGWSLGGHNTVRMDSMTMDEQKTALDGLAGWFAEKGLNAPDFSYPNGAYGGGLEESIKPYFRSGRTIIEYPETLPPPDPYRLKVMNIVSPVSLDALQTKLATLSERGELVILVFHRIEDNPLYETEIGTDEFTRICALIEESGIPVKTMAEVSSAFGEAASPIDWSGDTLFQPSKPSGPEVKTPAEEKTNILWDDLLHMKEQESPKDPAPTQIDFSLDWKMVWGLGGENPRYYNQIDDISLYLANDLSESARLFTSFGIQESSFEDLSSGRLDGSMFSLNSLYLEEALPRDITLTAGYFSPAPHHKWLQLTRSVKLESAFGQDMTPDYLWLQASLEGEGPWGIQAAMVPDVIGKSVPGYDRPVLTYEESDDGTADGYKLGVPNLFASAWVDSENVDGELAAALNGDALKVAAEGALKSELPGVTLLTSLGVKYTGGEDFITFPEWDHIQNGLRISAGLAGYVKWGKVTFNPGTAYQAVMYDDGTVRHLCGFDAGLLYKNMELYSVWNGFDLENLLWGVNSGFEAGFSLDYKEVTFITGYTMGGFSAASGLYGNNSNNEGALDGPFLRIKATYW